MYYMIITLYAIRCSNYIVYHPLELCEVYIRSNNHALFHLYYIDYSN